jgi:GMP synthase (glutamine-hydrolysing)
MTPREPTTLGLLLCDHVAPELLDHAGDYEAMFRALFSRHWPEARLRTFDLPAGEFPDSPNACDGWITSGSRHSANDPLPWIERLAGFIRACHAAKVPFTGICFGHQMIGRALGGGVARSPRGWGVGTRVAFPADQPPGCHPGGGTPVRLLYSHQDQIECLPPGAITLAGNDHCPHAIIACSGKMLGIQGHPEFTPAYARGLMQSRGQSIPHEVIEAASSTFSQPTDEATVIGWIRSMCLS